MEVDNDEKGRSPSPAMSGAKSKKKSSSDEKEREGTFLLGSPTFADLGNGRLRCKETGHELPAGDRDSYARSRACRLALIDAAVGKKKPPLNMFKQCPISKSKLVCELTGDTINKSEEHIWKHISGKRFQNRLEQKEMEKAASPEKVDKHSKKSKKPPSSGMDATKDKQKTKVDRMISDEENQAEKSCDQEEPDFWTPAVGERWDFDDGKDRWEGCTTSEHNEEEDGLDEGDEQHEIESMELSMRTKRMSIAVGPSSFASRKKKIKKASNNSNDSSNDV